MLITLLLLWLSGLSGSAAPYVPVGPAPAAPLFAAPLPDTLRRAGPDSLVQAQCSGYTRLRVGRVLFAGNQVTKEVVLRAELDFTEGDTLNAATLARRLELNRRRLFNLQLFHQVLVKAVCREGELTILYSFQERWYLFPVPIFSLADRNFASWRERPDRWKRVDYGLHLVRRNFRGRNEQLLANLQLGFNRKYELFYEAPGYGRHRRIGFGAGYSYYRARALDYATLDDRLRNLRQEDDFPIERQYATVGLRWRRTVQLLAALDASYHREQVSDSVLYYNPRYFLNGPRREYFEFSLTTTLNRRNTFAYPLSGQYAQLQVGYRSFLDSRTPGSLTLRGRYARYIALGGPFYYSVGATGQLRVARALAYPDNRALGYDLLVRGYDAYAVEGRRLGLLQQGLSLRLLDLGKIQLNGVPSSRFNNIPLVFYLNTFADVGYVGQKASPATNQLPNYLLASAGVGLHLVTYYDWVFTLEYARTREQQGGVFFRTQFPI
ncbi:BamA/TamA family outer membrane protein [Hymenobacter lapidiphilus]|uniref:BamA/TamA family outer membrane protein n=1 Tax=Hymenobacter lapidiphilus TaxID=2608003 RepID=A0A7Y7PPJ9_9BACT|nr:BamA/TamA family outer membrane protein [Hymenobacter lapidiphilus]NVO31457.1 BamA/TamA family outer membrane protein [Hymenobacter lapidiphilus]